MNVGEIQMELDLCASLALAPYLGISRPSSSHGWPGLSPNEEGPGNLGILDVS